jgi:hypothetical protein
MQTDNGPLSVPILTLVMGIGNRQAQSSGRLGHVPYVAYIGGQHNNTPYMREILRFSAQIALAVPLTCAILGVDSSAP